MTSGPEPPTTAPVTLENCDREPIHIPGHIQPHGVLLAFDREARLVAWSANAGGVLSGAPRAGCALDALGLPAEVQQAVRDCGAEMDDGGQAPPQAVETQLDGALVDAVVHGHRHRLILEFERRDRSRDELAAFALQAHRAVERLKRQRTNEALLQVAVREIRTLTGFDRVMGYRFRHDDSGDVVAEEAADGLEPYLGRRYPASDIPAQARRLYTLNTLRQIVDVGYTPVPVLARAGDEPLDMSFAHLRSVSPIHVEYLRNMGVGASMSVSIVVGDQLWGMLACHHRRPRLVPHSVRMACDVIAQVLATAVVSHDARERAELAGRATELNAQAVEALLHDDDTLRALSSQAQGLRALFGADALALVHGQRVVVDGDVPSLLAVGTADALAGVAEDLHHRHSIDQWPAALRGDVGRWVGLLALRFDPAMSGWLLAWRSEQIETVRWGGKPEKHIQPGPLGPRLTPRGSFEVWLETVRGIAVPWEPARLDSARSLLAAMHRASHLRHAELERARTQMLAILGHDLRDPLHTITMAAQALEHEHPQQQLGQRIRSSSGRMQRLIGQILDLSRLRGGLGLDLRPQATDLAHLLTDLVDESRVAHPGVAYLAELQSGLMLAVDADRLAQAVSNLLSNARHHGTTGQPIRLACRSDGEGGAWIEVRNVAPPIPQTLLPQLFSPFKPRGAASSHAGLGLGLYIAHEIALGHRGTLAYHSEPPEVLFRLWLPAGTPATAPPCEAATAGHLRRVLVIDDHRDNAESLCELLELEHYQGVPAWDTDTALRLAAEGGWLAIVVDVQMPGADGIDLARLWREQLRPRPRLVALSGHALPPGLVTEGPFDAVLRKPAELSTLVAVLQA